MNSCRLITVAVLVTILGSIGFDHGASAALPNPACSAAEIIAVEGPSNCPASGPCTITKIFPVGNGCVLDFGARNVTIAASGELRIAGATVTLKAANFTVAPGGLVDGTTTTVGGSFTVEANGNIAVQRTSTTNGKILVSGDGGGGLIVLDAGGDITIAGQLLAHNKDIPASSGGAIELRSGGNTWITSTGDVDPHGGKQAFGGSLDVTADGDVTIDSSIDATGGEGGSINIDAKGTSFIRDKLNTNGTGDEGSGGDVSISAETDVEINGQILNRGGTGGGYGGGVSITSPHGDVTVRSNINVQGGAPDGEGGEIEISALGFIDIQSLDGLTAKGVGSDSSGGDIALDAGFDVTVSGVVEASGGDLGGNVTIDAGRHVTLTKIIDVRGTSEGSSGGGSVAIEAGGQTPGDVTIEGEGKIDLRGGRCDLKLGCSAGGDAEIAACDITVSGLGIDASAPGNDGEGGDITLSARGQLTIISVLDATGGGVAGSNMLVHASKTQPDIIRPGRVTPAAETTACCTEPAPACSNSTCTGVCSAYCTSLCNCGDNTLDEFEECDGEQGCSIGVCTRSGSSQECVCIDTCGTKPGIQEGEECDGEDLPPDETCFSQGFLGGDKSGEGLSCADDCGFDFSGCVPKCGDGRSEPGEVCDPSVAIEKACTDVGVLGVGPLTCMDDCTEYDKSACNDGYCGDGFPCAVPGCAGGPGGGPEECDDGNSSDNDSCLSDCTRALCGDGKLCSAADCDTRPDGGPEECDDGNSDDNDACRNDCGAASCGDGIVCSAANCTSGPGGGPEECEPQGDPCCRSFCALRPCNETTCSSTGGLCCPPGETCDDGNTCTDDQCDQSTGCSHTPITCNDGDACTDDSCDPVNGCSYTPISCETTDRCFVGACNAALGGCQFNLRLGFEFLDCLIRYDVEQLTASIKGFAGNLGPKETKRLLKLVAGARKKIEAAGAKGKGKKAAKRLKGAEKQLKKFMKRLARLAKKKGKGDIAAELGPKATAIQVSLQQVRAEIS